MFPSEFSARFTDLRNSHTLPSRYSEEKKTLSQVGLSEGILSIFTETQECLFMFHYFLKGTNAHVFAVVVALQTCSCMLSYPRSPRPQSALTPPSPRKLLEPRPPVNVLASPPFSVFPSRTHLPNALSSLVCESCVLHSCVCVCVCVRHVHSVDSPLCSPLSPLLTSALCLSATWIYLFRALLSVIEMYQIFPSKPDNSYRTEQLTAEFTQIHRLIWTWLGDKRVNLL